MRLSEPRIPPLPESEWSDDLKELAGPLAARGRVYNIFRTFLRAPEAFKAFLAYGGYILSRRNSLPPREREIVILRTGYLCRSGYEWTQHVPIGQAAGLIDDEIERIKAGAEAAGWSGADKALLAACDDLYRDQFISAPAWSALQAHFSDRQCMDLILTVGQYVQVSMFLNTLGVQLDPGQRLDPDLGSRE